MACWGNESFVESAPAIAFTQIAIGWRSCGLHDDGNVTCWGPDNSNAPLDVTEQFSQIDAGDHHVCGLLLSGDLSCWGRPQARSR